MNRDTDIRRRQYRCALLSTLPRTVSALWSSTTCGHIIIMLMAAVSLAAPSSALGCGATSKPTIDASEAGPQVKFRRPADGRIINSFCQQSGSDGINFEVSEGAEAAPREGRALLCV